MMKRKMIISVLLGAALGVVEAIVLLLMLSSEGFLIGNGRFILCLAAGWALPLCTEFLRTRNTFHILSVQVTMIVVSFAIALGYGGYVNSASALASAYSDIFTRVTGSCGLIQAGALVICVIRNAVCIRREKK